MTTAIVIEQYGGPDVMQARDVVVGHPGPDQVKLQHTRIGVNFHDVYVRSGLYKTLALPGTPGIEAAGVVTEVGSNVHNVKVGDRVAYVTGAYGVYAAERLLDAKLLIALPDSVSDEVAASVLLRGLTVDMLLNRVHQVQAGNTVLVHAAAGGVGQMLCQWAAHLGAVVIGTVRNDAQAAMAQAAGCHHIIRHRDENIPERVKDITQGRGADVVYDGVGQDTFQGSLDALALCGHLVNFGQASGPVPPFLVSSLATKSNSVSRPIIFHYVQDRAQRLEMANNVFEAVAGGWLKVGTPREFALEQAAECHRVLEAEGAGRPLLLVP
ncbi:quinone oxidoreductase [Alcaligenaceae bacterium]|nr:quinone oxidoreductase [Alcaligenaceae bacterium]